MDDRFLNFRYPIARRVLRRPDGGWTYARYARRIFQSKLTAMGDVRLLEALGVKDLSPWAAVVQVDMPKGNRGHQVATYAINYVPHACDECRVDRPCAHDRFPPHPADEVWLMNGSLKAYATVRFPDDAGELALVFVEQNDLTTIYHCVTPDDRMVKRRRVSPALWAAMMAQLNH